MSKKSLWKVRVPPFSYGASAHPQAKPAARARIPFQESLIDAGSRSLSFQQAQHREYAAQNRERVCQHRTSEAPRQASLQAGKIALSGERLQFGARRIVPVLGGLAHDVGGDGTGLLGREARTGQLPCDCVGIDHKNHATTGAQGAVACRRNGRA